jgi:fucose 4-O-acetylase-like acetyltransferase
MNKRIGLWDVVKGLGIIFIVIGHSGFAYSSLFYLFHVSMFFIVSLMLFNDSYCAEPGVFIRKRIKSLYVPALLYFVFFALAHGLFVRLGIISASNAKYSLTHALIRCIYLSSKESLAGSLWFIAPLLLVMLIFMFIWKAFLLMSNNAMRVSFAIALVVLLGGTAYCINTKDIRLPFYMNLLPILLSQLILAKILKQVLTKKAKFLEYAIEVCLLFLIWMALKNNSIDLSLNRIINPIIFLLCSFLGFRLVYQTAYLIEKTSLIKDVLSYIGESSYTIMAMHLLVFKLVDLFIYHFINSGIVLSEFTHSCTGIWWIYAIVGVALSVAVRKIGIKSKTVIVKTMRRINLRTS